MVTAYLQGKKGIWLSVPTSRMELLVPAQALGFEVHHAEKEYVMLNRWLGTACTQRA